MLLQFTQLTILSLPRVGEQGIPLANEGQSGARDSIRLRTYKIPPLSHVFFPHLRPTSYTPLLSHVLYPTPNPLLSHVLYPTL